MSLYVATENPSRFAVVRRWKDNQKNFQILDYFDSEAACRAYIAKRKKNSLYKYEICVFI